jgi:dTDP-glucose 4,6-dehydratase
MKYNSVLVTGGLGFIGSNFVDLLINKGIDKNNIIVLDKYTYAASENNLINFPKENIIKGDICDADLVYNILNQNKIDLVINFAAESHVDNSINSPDEFINTNIVGTAQMLKSCYKYYKETGKLLFVHISTDEVFGSLGEEGYFSENTPYDPRSPYSASKASSDHLVNAWYHTFGLPIIITNCSNNYGPKQHNEKLIPKTILNMLQNKKTPVYGNGKNIRDWIHVEDHCNGIFLAIEKGKIGESYCFGGNCERTNIDIVKLIESKIVKNNKSLIEFTIDRKGHDFRYAIDNAKVEKELGFIRKYNSIEESIDSVISWYKQNINNIDLK